MRLRRIVILLCFALVLAAWGTARAVDHWRYRSSIEQAKARIASGSPADARRLLAQAAERWPGAGEAEFLLGACEQALGRPDAAVAAWLRVPADSQFAGHAAMLHVRLILKSDHFAAAEVLLPAALRAAGQHAIEARETLVSLLKLEGRFDELRTVVQDGWATYPDRFGLLRQLANLDSINPVPIEKIWPALEKAAENSPDDDRIWLGRANLAIRRGEYDRARRWLDQCLKRLPHDASVWKSRLDLALATGAVTEAREALKQLPPDRLPAAELLSVRAWFAARAGDQEIERQALERLLERSPARVGAVERLAELELLAGRPEKAAQLRARKAELDRAKIHYEILVTKPSSEAIQHSTEMARLAEELDRQFEARALWSVVLERSPGDKEAGEALKRLEAARDARPALTLAGLLAELDTVPIHAESPGEPSSSAPAFTDDAKASGLEFTFDNGATPARQIPETMSGGVGLLDFDADGWLDVYLVQGGPFPPPGNATSATNQQGTAPDPGAGDRLFRNRGDGTFEDVTAASGIAKLAQGYGHGVAVGDYDNDGHPDLFITRWRAYALFHNQGDGTFRDVTQVMGLDGDRDWPTSAAFADLDGDGDLDLYVCHYLKWDAEHPRICWDEEKKRNSYCAPQHFHHLPDHLFRNDGNRFVDVTESAGINDWHGQGLGVVAADLDDDGRMDLFVANDQSPNYLFRNLGGLKFEECAESTGVAGNGKGGFQAGMGVACGDLDGDGRPDLGVTNFYNESMTFYKNLGGGVFVDHTAMSGLAVPTRYRLGFGTAFLDVDNDGHLDIAIANGHVDDFRPEIPYAMPAQLLLGSEGGRLTDVSDRAGPPWRLPRVCRGLAAGDLDNDGRIDLLLVSQDVPLAYLHNRTSGGHHFTLRLEGKTSNRDAVGARVTVIAGGRRQIAWRFGGGSYQSASDPRLHLGLGDASAVEKLEVAWPSGRVDRYGPLAVDAGYLIREGQATAIPLAAFPPASSNRSQGPAHGYVDPRRSCLSASLGLAAMRPAQVVDILVSELGGDRKTVLGSASEDDIDGTRQITVMAWRNVERLDAVAGAEHGTDRLAGVEQRGPLAALEAGIGMLADEPRLGTADRRNTQPETQMTGQTDPARMCDALAVNQENIRRLPERSVRFDDPRSLTKAEEAGNVREGCLGDHTRPLDDFAGPGAHHDNGRKEPLSAQIKRNIGAGDRRDRTQ
jgi:tetratricopeptide (TPR) repeat protein